MKRAIGRTLAVIGVLFAASGCVDMTTEVFVKKDGSAQISQATYLSPQAVAMMAQQSGGKASSLINEAELKQMAAKMGKGATFVGAEERTRKDGWKGYVARYSIPDVNDLMIDEAMTAPTSGQGGALSQGAVVQAAPKTGLRFRFTPGEVASLAIAVPQQKSGEGAGGAGNPQADLATDPAAVAMAQQMKAMFQGMRMWVRVRVDGAISESNAQHLNPKKTGFTLMKIDFGQLVADEKGFATLQALGKEADPQKMRAALKDFPYIQIEDQDRVNAKFQ